VTHESDKITVEIFGEKHVVRGEGTAPYIQGLAHEVDKKMRLIAQRLPRLGAQRIAVLTALNLADELAKLREEQETLMQLLGEKTE
jgi:cell division protein ZapA